MKILLVIGDVRIANPRSPPPRSTSARAPTHPRARVRMYVRTDGRTDVHTSHTRPLPPTSTRTTQVVTCAAVYINILFPCFTPFSVADPPSKLGSSAFNIVLAPWGWAVISCFFSGCSVLAIYTRWLKARVARHAMQTPGRLLLGGAESVEGGTEPRPDAGGLSTEPLRALQFSQVDAAREPPDFTTSPP